MRKWSKALALTATCSMLLSQGALAEEALYPPFDSTVDPEIEGELRINIYYSDTDTTLIDHAVGLMKEKYPNLTLNLEHRTDSDGTQLKTWAAVGELPDYMDVPDYVTHEILVESGDAYALNDAIEATNYFDHFVNGDLYKAAHTEDDGMIYAFGTETTHVLQVFYNISLFEELGLSEPTNYDEFKNCIVTLKEAGKVPIALFGAEQWPGMALYELAAVGEGALQASLPINEGEKKYADDEAYYRAAQKIQELAELGAFGSGALSTNADQAFELLKTGEAGFLVNGSWFWNTAETGGYSDNIGWCHNNVFADPENVEAVKGYCVGGAFLKQGFMVNANPPSGLDPEDVARLSLEFEYYTKVALGEHGKLTSAKGDYTLVGSDTFQDFCREYSTFKNFIPLPQEYTNGALVSTLGSAIEMIISGNSTAEDFMEEMAAGGF